MSPARPARRTPWRFGVRGRTRAQQRALRQLRAALTRSIARPTGTQPPLTLATYLHAVGIWGDDTAAALTSLGLAQEDELETVWRLCLHSELIEPNGDRNPPGWSSTPTGHAVLTALANAGTRATYAPAGARP